MDPDGRLGKGAWSGLTSGDSGTLPFGSSGAFDAGYGLGSVYGGYLSGLATGTANIGVGAWDTAVGALSAAWEFTGGSLANLAQGEQTIYGALGSFGYGLATSADVRSATWSGFTGYVTDTFTDTSLFSQRIGGGGLISLATLGAGPAVRSLGWADEVADAGRLARAVDDLAGAKNGATLADDLAAAATRARNTVGQGSGGAYGTRVHTAFEAEVQGLNRGLSTEISYLNGNVVLRGTPGSVRLDVVNGPLNAPVSIFDLKTGSATLTPARIQQIQSHIPGGANVPVFPVRP
jgi:hypothetical protein